MSDCEFQNYLTLLATLLRLDPRQRGAIAAYNGLFVVSQTADVHKQVEHLFDMLRQAAGLEVTKTGKVVR